jgi:hypothetical protein
MASATSTTTTTARMLARIIEMRMVRLSISALRESVA